MKDVEWQLRNWYNFVWLSGASRASGSEMALTLEVKKALRFEVPEHGSAEVVDATERIVMPGLVDTHVHINEPGRTEWEGFDTATRAAGSGRSRDRAA